MSYLTQDNLEFALALLGAVTVVAALVAKATPNTKDDAIVAKLKKFLDWASMSLRK